MSETVIYILVGVGLGGALVSLACAVWVYHLLRGMWPQ